MEFPLKLLATGTPRVGNDGLKNSSPKAPPDSVCDQPRSDALARAPIETPVAIRPSGDKARPVVAGGQRLV